MTYVSRRFRATRPTTTPAVHRIQGRVVTVTTHSPTAIFVGPAWDVT